MSSIVPTEINSKTMLSNHEYNTSQNFNLLFCWINLFELALEAIWSGSTVFEADQILVRNDKGYISTIFHEEVSLVR